MKQFHQNQFAFKPKTRHRGESQYDKKHIYCTYVHLDPRKPGDYNYGNYHFM